MVDTGRYNKNQGEYARLAEQLYEQYPQGVTLPADYAAMVENNLLQFTVRLARYKFVARQLKKSDRVLEVGCGSGLGSIFLAQHCEQVAAIDIKATEIAEARGLNRRNNVEFSRADFFTLEANPKYNVIVCLDVIEHLTAEQADKMIHRMPKFLRPGGMIAVGTPSLYSCPYQSPLSRASHRKCYDRGELIEAIEKYFQRTLTFSMNDEVVHTGFEKLAWYYFVLGFYPKEGPPGDSVEYG